MIRESYRLQESVPVIKVKGQISPLDETGTTPIVLQMWHDKDPPLLVVHGLNLVALQRNVVRSVWVKHILERDAKQQTNKIVYFVFMFYKSLVSW